MHLVWVKHKIEDRLAMFLQVCPGNRRRHNYDKRNVLGIEILEKGMQDKLGHLQRCIRLALEDSSFWQSRRNAA